jgi:hypothetical protein
VPLAIGQSIELPTRPSLHVVVVPTTASAAAEETEGKRH